MTNKVKDVTKVNWRTVGSVALGMAVFGAVIYGVRMLPSNAVTDPIKSAANAVTV